MRGGVTFILILVGLAGAGTMIVELAAVRLLAPWFGTSSAVWTNVIGVVLLALSVGYLLGARLATREGPLRRLGFLLASAGVFTLALPLGAGPIARLFVPAGVALADTPELFVWGSLAASLCLFGPAAAMLGSIGPLATECLQERGEKHAGAAGGRVLFAGTLGSLAGTFATTHFALPRLGLTLTFLFAGAGLVVLGGGVLVTGARRSVSALVVLFIASGALLATSRLDGPKLAPDTLLLAAIESPYQSLRVVQRGSGDELERHLQVNEGLDSFQSVWRSKAGFLPHAYGYYYNAFALPLFWDDAPGADVDDRYDVCVIGFGAGTAWRVLSGASSRELAMVGVEIDSAVIELGHEWMELPRDDERLSILSGWDGRAALRTLSAPVELVILDAYANQSEIPAHLSSLEFFEEVEAKLTSGGVLAINVGGFGFDDPVVSAVARTVSAAFEQRVLCLRIPFSRNFALFARRDADPPEPGADGWRPAETAGEEGDALIAALEIRSAWRWLGASGGDVLTDDTNPIDRLQEASLRSGGRALLEDAP